MYKTLVRKLVVTSAFAVLIRISYIYFFKESILSSEFNSYIFLTSIFAMCASLISPIDGISARFIKTSTADNIFGYAIFHIIIRLLIFMLSYLLLINLVSFPSEVSFFAYNAIFLGIAGAVLANFVYVSDIGSGKNNFKVNFVFILPILIKFILLLICIKSNLKFNEIIIICETIQFLTCLFILIYKLNNLYVKNIKLNLIVNAKLFFKQIRLYGYQSIILIPASYIKTNFAPLLSSLSLNADGTFYIMLIQKFFDQVRSVLSRPNMLLSGFAKPKSLIAYSYLFPIPIIFMIGTLGYFNFYSIVFLFFCMRLVDILIFLSTYNVAADYMKLPSFHGYNRYIFIPEFMFIFCVLVLEKTLIIFMLLMFLRAIFGFISWRLFSQLNFKTGL